MAMATTNPVLIDEDTNPRWLAQRWLVKTSCHDCFVDVECSASSDWKWVNMSLLSGHPEYLLGRLRQRVKTAWEVLRGYRGKHFIDFDEVEELDALIFALTAARTIVFPAQEENMAGDGKNGDGKSGDSGSKDKDSGGTNGQDKDSG